MRLRDKSIVIVGGTSGLGLSAATACAGEGARVLIVGRDETKVQQALEELGESARGIVGDARQPQTAVDAVAEAVKHFGQLDGLYHVAGGSGRAAGDGPLHSTSDEGWQVTLEENLTSTFHSDRAALQQLIAQGSGGSILNMASVLAFSPAPQYFATHAYAASKAAIIGLSKSAAAYYAPHNIRINALAPALVETPMSQRAAADDETRNYIGSKQPLDGGRIGRPEDLDQAVVYLLSDDSRWVTGQVLSVDGGWTVSEGQYPG